MSTFSVAVSQPSMAGHHVVYLCAGQGWCVLEGTSTPVRIELGPGRVRHLLGDPDGDGCVATIETEGVIEVRALSHLTAQPIVALTTSAPVQPIAWLDRRRILLGVPEPDGAPCPLTLAELDLDAPGSLRTSDLSQLRTLDMDRAGRRVAVTAGIHPAVVRAWRGGSRGRVLRDDGAGHWRPDPTDWANPGDACVLGDRIFALDDPDGRVDLYSVPVEGGPIASHHVAAGGAVTSLRRGRDRLVLGREGGVILVDPAAGMVTEVPRPSAHEVESTPAPQPWTAESVHPDFAGAALVGVGQGRVVVAHDGADEPWVLPRSTGFAVAAGWTGRTTLSAVLRADGHTTVVDLELHTSTLTFRDLPAAARDLHPDDAAIGPHGLALSSAADGVVWVPREGGLRVLESSPAHRRGRPVLSSDGSFVAWSEETELAGSTVRVARTSTGAVESVRVPGASARLPVFDADHDLLFVSTPVSPLTGSAAPVADPTVVCAVDPNEILRADPSTAPPMPRVRVLARGLRDVSALTVDGAQCWVEAASGRHTLGAVAEEQSRSERRRDQGDRLDAVTLPSSPESGTWLMQRCLDLAATRSVDPLARAEYLAASDRLGTWAAHCVGDDELDVALRAALREVGQSHTALVDSAPPIGDDLPGVIARVPESRARARDRLHGRAHYVAVPDVFVAGVAAVEALCRSWRGDAPLVLDLRYNQGGPFADYLTALLSVLFTRDAVAQRPGEPVRTLLGGPAYINVLVNEHTGSGGEQLAAALARHPRVIVLGRRTAGAGTGFHQRWSLGGQRWVVLPQYRLGHSRSLDIENEGVAPHRHFPHDPSAGSAHDDALLDALPLAPQVHSETDHHRNHEVTHLDEGGIHDRVAL